MTDIPENDVGPCASRRLVDLRLSMREAFVAYSAVRDKEAALRKEAWWLGERGGLEGAADLRRLAQEHADAADRIFWVLDGIMDRER